MVFELCEMKILREKLGCYWCQGEKQEVIQQTVSLNHAPIPNIFF